MKLSPRKLEILTLLAHGFTDKEIALAKMIVSASEEEVVTTPTTPTNPTTPTTSTEPTTTTEPTQPTEPTV